MTIPANFVAPSLPYANPEFEGLLEEKFRNVLRLYFKQLDNHNSVINEQVASNQTNIWLNM